MGSLPIVARPRALRAPGCIMKCCGAVSAGQQSQDHSPMALSGRAVSQHLWLAHGAARLRAHEGWFDPAVLPRRTAAGYLRPAAVRGGRVTRVGRFLGGVGPRRPAARD